MLSLPPSIRRPPSAIVARVLRESDSLWRNGCCVRVGLGVVVFVVLLCDDTGMRADQEAERAVLALLDAFNDALGHRDLDATLALFVADADVTLVGSEEGETATGPSELRSFFERSFARPGTFCFERRLCTVSARCDVAWFFADTMPLHGARACH
jgi:ketosteroid isomerase-like protein